MAHAPGLEFPGATIEAIEFRRPGRGLIRSCFLGLTGPMGALPLHLTEYANFERRYARRHPFGCFLDLITDRMLQFFYRAWADSQPACQADRPEDDPVRGLHRAAHWPAQEGAAKAEAFPLKARLHYAGLFISRRSAAAPQDGLTHLLRTPVRILEFVGGWRTVEPEDLTRLGGARPRAASALGGRRHAGRTGPHGAGRLRRRGHGGLAR